MPWFHEAPKIAAMSEILAPTAEDDAEARSRAEEQETLREVEELSLIHI